MIYWCFNKFPHVIRIKLKFVPLKYVQFKGNIVIHSQEIYEIFHAQAAKQFKFPFITMNNKAQAPIIRK